MDYFISKFPFSCSDVFVSHVFLREISLSHNQLGSSTNLIILPPLVRKLTLTNNELTTLEIRPSACASIPPLQWLRAEMNLLIHVPVGLPIFGATLQKIYLHDNPDMLAIHAHEVEHLTHVDRLHLQDNNLKHITDLRHMASDLELNLENNNNLACDDFLAWLKDEPNTWTVDYSNAVCQYPTMYQGTLFEGVSRQRIRNLATTYAAPSSPISICPDAGSTVLYNNSCLFVFIMYRICSQT